MKQFAVCWLALIVTTVTLGQEPKSKSNLDFTRSEHMVVMRDGVKLNTIVHAPKDNAEKLPIIFSRTPYGINGSNPRSSLTVDMAKEGYIFVYQDIRGRHKSEGQFVMCRPPRDAGDTTTSDELTDTYDTIDWLVKNIPNNNGRVGMLGISYDGWTTAMATLDPHPALKAASPQAAMGDVYMGDDFYHHGAFRLSYGYEYCYMMETGKTQNQPRFDKADMYEWYLKLGPLSNANAKYLNGKVATWNDFMAHPNRDEFWKKRAVPLQVKKTTVPCMHIVGWWDQEDYSGSIAIYAAMEKLDTDKKNFIVMGPWNHGGWAGNGRNLGAIPFGSDTGTYYRTQIQPKFFAHYLKDGPAHELPEALSFKTGANEWIKNETWPPKNTEVKKLYFQAGGKLSFDAPKEEGETAADSYISDPNKPAPYRVRPIPPTYSPGSTWSSWLVTDQRHAQCRPDVLSWETEPLKEDITFAGDAWGKLIASTTGSDADFVVKLIDVHPEDAGSLAGYQLMVASEIMRARFRKSFEKPEPMTPNTPEAVNVDLHWMHHTFKKGHKIMVQVQSSWFPLYDRNPQKFVPNIFEAKESDFITATHKIHRSATAASCVEVRVEKAP